MAEAGRAGSPLVTARDLRTAGMSTLRIPLLALGVCLISLHANLAWQAEFTAGLILRLRIRW